MEIILDLEEELFLVSANGEIVYKIICHENGSGIQIMDLKRIK